MKYRIICILFIFTSLSVSYAQVDADEAGQEEVSRSEMPWNVLMTVNFNGLTEHHAGSYLGGKWVVTTASSGVNDYEASDIKIKFGSIESCGSFEEVLQVSKIYVHPNFENILGGRIQNDIALLELETEPQNIGPFVQGISYGPYIEGKELIFSGWREHPEVADCDLLYKGVIDASHVVDVSSEWLTILDGDEGIYSDGEVGGPNVINLENDNENPLLVAITSKEGNRVNISYFDQWIQSVMAEDEPGNNHTNETDHRIVIIAGSVVGGTVLTAFIGGAIYFGRKYYLKRLAEARNGAIAEAELQANREIAAARLEGEQETIQRAYDRLPPEEQTDFLETTRTIEDYELLTDAQQQVYLIKYNRPPYMTRRVARPVNVNNPCIVPEIIEEDLTK